MAYKKSKRKRITETDQALRHRQSSIDLEAVPNSATDVMKGHGKGSLPNSAMNDLVSDRAPAAGRGDLAEQEADRLSAAVTSTTPETLRQEMGRRLGADFSGVRFHTDERSAGQAGHMGARAYAQGGDVYFGDGGFNPKVAAHELVHTVQQGAVDGAVSQSVPMGTIQMKKETEEEKANRRIERLFRIQAGLSSGIPNLVSSKDRKWYEEKLKNASPELIRELLRRRDAMGVALVNRRREMERNNPGDKTAAELDYDVRNSNTAFDMNVYHALALKTTSTFNFIGAHHDYKRARNKDTNAVVNRAYEIMRDRTYNREEDFVEANHRVAEFRERSKAIYQNPNLYQGWRKEEGIGKNWNLVGTENNKAKVTGEAVLAPSVWQQDPREFQENQKQEAYDFFGLRNPNGVFEQWRNNLKPREYTGLRNYTKEHGKGNYKRVNIPLRTGKTLSGGVKRQSEAMVDGINKFGLPHDLIVHRGAGAELLGGITDPAKIKKYFVGRTVKDKGYMSTSAVKGSQFPRDVHFIIRIPAGLGRGAFIRPISFIQKEDEFLLKRGSLFLIKDAYMEGGKTVVEMDMRV